MWAVDTFAGDAGTERFTGPVSPDNLLAEFRRNTSDFTFLNVIVARSTEAAVGFADASLDWVFIDADHSYGAVAADIGVWARKLRPGGLRSGHDFAHPGVMDAVYHAYPRPSNAGNIWFTRDRPRSRAALAPRMFWRKTRGWFGFDQALSAV